MQNPVDVVRKQIYIDVKYNLFEDMIIYKKDENNFVFISSLIFILKSKLSIEIIIKIKNNILNKIFCLPADCLTKYINVGANMKCRRVM